MKCKFHIGQKVVHVPNMGGEVNHREAFSYLSWPEPNGVYTIRFIRPAKNFAGEESIGVLLEEIPDQQTRKGEWVGFSADEFQPLSFLDLDISIFTKMLTPERERQSA